MPIQIFKCSNSSRLIRVYFKPEVGSYCILSCIFIRKRSPRGSKNVSEVGHSFVKLLPMRKENLLSGYYQFADILTIVCSYKNELVFKKKNTIGIEHWHWIVVSIRITNEARTLGQGFIVALEVLFSSCL